MRILVYGISNQKGGISEFMMSLNKKLSEKNICFDYIIKGKNSVYESQINEMNGKVLYYNYKNKFERVSNLYKIMKDERKKTNVFYYNTSGTFFVFPIFFAKLLGYKIISHAHCGRSNNLNFVYVFLNFINRIFLNLVSSSKLSCSDVAHDWVYGKSKNVIQVNNAIDSKKFFYSDKRRNEIRKKMNLSEKDFVLINVGRVEYPKNQKFLIELMKKLNNHDDNFKLFFVGDGSDFTDLDLYTKKNNVKNVKFLGQRNDINDLLNASDLFLLPSFYEGFPIVCVEAQATGLTCILSDYITKTANITGNVKFLSLDKSDEWVNFIFNYAKNYQINKRKDMNVELKKCGFDEQSISKIVYSQILKICKE